MDNNSIATVVGLGVQTVSTVLQTYVTFKQSNVEKYFELLLQEDKDLKNIGTNDQLKRLFFKIIDNVANETRDEKIKNWKNLTVKLATQLDNLDFADNLTKMLEDLTAFDLTVLFAIYSTDFKAKYFKKELIEYFNKRGARPEYIGHSLRRLSSHNLISEESDSSGFIGSENDDFMGQEFSYQKNDLGKSFIFVISNE
jgi:hypothetical protein